MVTGRPVATRKDVARNVHLGLLVLRGAALFLLLTYGWQKFWGYTQLARAGGSWDSAGLAPLVRSMGFPLPVLLGVYATLCESVAALFVACGIFTRLMATLLLFSTAGSFYVSMRLPEEPVRALLYVCIFAGLALTGPGRFSVDQWLCSRRHT
jgi:uncharacterized membrane protein YphA (DoxX/SURF4 family)